MGPDTQGQPTWLDLYDYRLSVAAIYRERDLALTRGDPPEAVLDRFRAEKDALFAAHPQSALPLDDRARFRGLRYYPYNAGLECEAVLTPAVPTEQDEPAGDWPLRTVGMLRFSLSGLELRLTLYWIDVYGGGLFLPFLDETSGDETYGGGRYLADTVKGSDLVHFDHDPQTPGYRGGRVLLDFNYAYNPSCVYDPRWSCPLAPRENRLSVPIRAGELLYRL